MNKFLRLKIIEKYDSQTNFSQKMGVHESFVSQVIHGRRVLDSETQEVWAKVLGCKAGDLFQR